MAVTSRKNKTDKPARKPRGLPEPYERFGEDGEDPTRVQHPQRQASPIELALIQRRGVGDEDGEAQWVAVEIWTQNRIYLVGNEMACIGVYSRSEAKHEEGHSLLGAVLTGGRGKNGKEVTLSQPYPLPGMKAVFRYQVGGRSKFRFATTSVVERIMLRVNVMTLDCIDPGESFHELTARFFM